MHPMPAYPGNFIPTMPVVYGQQPQKKVKLN